MPVSGFLAKRESTEGPHERFGAEARELGIVTSVRSYLWPTRDAADQRVEER